MRCGAELAMSNQECDNENEEKRGGTREVGKVGGRWSGKKSGRLGRSGG